MGVLYFHVNAFIDLPTLFLVQFSNLTNISSENPCSVKNQNVIYFIQIVLRSIINMQTLLEALKEGILLLFIKTNLDIGIKSTFSK